MSALKDFLNNEVVLMLAHLLILVLVILNVQYLFFINYAERETNILIKENLEIQNSLDDLRDQVGYQNTDFYKEKEYRNEGRQKKGEITIDTSAIESEINSEGNYIEVLNVKGSNNFQKWMQCFFAERVWEKSVISVCKD
jgi:hypothetical protein